MQPSLDWSFTLNMMQPLVAPRCTMPPHAWLNTQVKSNEWHRFLSCQIPKKNALCVKLFGDDLFELCSKHWSPTAQGGLRTLSPRRRRAFSRSFHWMGQCDWRGRRFESTWAKWHICLVLLKACRDTSLQILVYIYIYTIYLYIHGKSLNKHGCWCDKNLFQWYDAT